jgi:hypothetical protein
MEEGMSAAMAQSTRCSPSRRVRREAARAVVVLYIRSA